MLESPRWDKPLYIFILVQCFSKKKSPRLPGFHYLKHRGEAMDLRHAMIFLIWPSAGLLDPERSGSPFLEDFWDGWIEESPAGLRFSGIFREIFWNIPTLPESNIYIYITIYIIYITIYIIYV